MNSSENLGNICRTCLSTKHELYTINSNNEFSLAPLSFKEMLKICISLETLDESWYPQNICKQCMEDLKVSYMFRTKCINAEVALRNLNDSFISNSMVVHNKGELAQYCSDHNDGTPQIDKELIQAINYTNGDEHQLEQELPKTEHDETTAKFACRKCDKCFLTYTDLKCHNDQHPKTDVILCRFCSKQFFHIRHIGPHIAKEHCGKIQYSCGYCDFVTKGDLDMDDHMKSHQASIVQPDVDTHACQICLKIFKSNSLLKRHVLTHDPDKPFHCGFNKCKWSFADEEDLQTHINVNHSNGKNECIYCLKCFKESRLLRQHMITHKPTKRFKCQYCSKGFNLLHHYKNHERIHTKDLQFLCAECGKAFGTKDRLTLHQKLHSDIRPYKCTYCGKSFVSNSRLRGHQKTHTDERPFMCTFCGLRFTANNNLNKHVINTHTPGDRDDCNARSYFCGLCQSNFQNSSDLSEHMKVHTCQYFCEICSKSFSLMSALETHIKTHMSGNRSHICHSCDAAFNRPEHLKYHIMRRHTGLKPFKCNICDRGFIQSGELNIHMRRHTGERPYTCQVCTKGFIQSNALRSHMRTHTGERPYKCGVCQKGHSTSGGLTQHIRSHNREAILKNK